MLSFLNAVVELVDLRNNQLLFRSNRKYSEGAQLDVKVALPPGSGKVTTLPVRVLNSRPLENGGMLYNAQVMVDIAGMEMTGTVRDPSLRRAPRYAVSVRVRSRRLPGYRGLTVDLSRTGLQLEADGPVQPGETLDLTLEFDRHDLAELSCDARVVWCRQDPRTERFRVGLEFTPSTAMARQDLNRVAEFFEGRAHAGVEKLLEESKRVHQQPAHPAAAVAEEPEPPTATVDRRLGFNIPLEAVVQGVWWDLAGKRLLLILQGLDGGLHQLEFPNCKTVRDHCTVLSPMSRYLRSASQSDWLASTLETHPGHWRHYQLLDPRGKPILELISGPCRVPDA